ncbi:MAG: hypothetical protein LUH05_07840 [Candidatus Gastranaerophilales bacterium]|nr:hypothetical protein [Candidatus Gastranaerophilales bacterium]
MSENSETFCQTSNIVLMSIAGALPFLPITITKIIPFLNKHSDKYSGIKAAANLLKKYKNASFNIAGKNIAVSKLAAAVCAVGSAVFYVKGIKNSMETHHGRIRKASFDADQNIINDPKLFAILTPEQEKQVQNYVESSEHNNFVDKLKDKINKNSSFKEAAMYKHTYNDYMKKKSLYMESVNLIPDVNLSEKQEEQAKQDNMLFVNLLKNVEHDVLEPLRRIETIANISCYALLMGGFIEYLITDKLIKNLGVKNKISSMAIKIGAPILTYLLLDKTILNIENKAILATKYKYLKKFTENPQEYNQSHTKEKKENLFDFLKTVSKDMKEYEKFSQEELPKIENRMEAKRKIELTPQQEKDAKVLQKNTSMVLNNQREELYNYSVGISALSETIIGPIDAAATAVGGFIGYNMAKKCGNKKIQVF